MKHLSASFFAIALTAVTTPCLMAQEPSAFGLAPGAAPAKTESLIPEGLPLIPDSLPSPDAPKAGDDQPEKKSKTSEAEDALRAQIKLRVAKTKAQSDPELQELWDSRLKAKSDYEQREIMTNYYNRLCDRIAKIDKTLDKEVVESLRQRYVTGYDQTRIAPTVPPAGAAASAATPTPAKSRKR
jgi:hypothetical protein